MVVFLARRVGKNRAEENRRWERDKREDMGRGRWDEVANGWIGLGDRIAGTGDIGVKR